ncbi:MAG: sugar transferase [Cyclobacteriaceae bacterium]|jgi:undecaprenyl phosphate N,N'-diacetylbacillosamine 1-phosphate transferase
MNRNWYTLFGKRFLDVTLSILLLLLLLPLFVSTYLLLLISNKGKPFFLQSRPGYLEKEIKIIKFKSMLDIPSEANVASNSDRITIVGRFIRKTSIDEIPQLINVIKGDMSLVGPRPLLYKYIPLYSPQQRSRHLVKPGITGLAQVNGRNSISWTQKFAFDIDYVEKISFKMDIKILLLTAVKIFRVKEVNQSNQQTMEPFNGHN